MKSFKFLKYPIVISFNEDYIYAGETFFIMNRHRSIAPGEDYVIGQMMVGTQFRHEFKPEYYNFYYFKTEEEAQAVKDILIDQDNEIEKLRKYYKLIVE